MPTSTLHDVRSQAVAVSGELPGMLQGVAVLQMITLVIGAAEAGPKFGTASGPGGAVGLALGLVFGDVLALGEGVPPPVVAPPRCVRMKPPVPSRSSSTTPITAGISHAGRSDGPPPVGLRATVGLRAGVGAGARSGVGAGAEGAGTGVEAANGAVKGGGAAAGSGGVGFPEGGT